MLGNYADVSPGCKGCCFESEPASYWLVCEYCIRNIKALEPTDDRWTPMDKKHLYFDSR